MASTLLSALVAPIFILDVPGYYVHHWYNVVLCPIDLNGGEEERYNPDQV